MIDRRLELARALEEKWRNGRIKGLARNKKALGRRAFQGRVDVCPICDGAGFHKASCRVND